MQPNLKNNTYPRRSVTHTQAGTQAGEQTHTREQIQTHTHTRARARAPIFFLLNKPMPLMICDRLGEGQCCVVVCMVVVLSFSLSLCGMVCVCLRGAGLRLGCRSWLEFTVASE